MNNIQQYSREEMVSLLQFVKERGYKPVDFTDNERWLQFGTKNGWLIGGMSIIKSSSQVVDEYLESITPNNKVV